MIRCSLEDYTQRFSEEILIYNYNPHFQLSDDDLKFLCPPDKKPAKCVESIDIISLFCSFQIDAVSTS